LKDIRKCRDREGQRQNLQPARSWIGAKLHVRGEHAASPLCGLAPIALVAALLCLGSPRGRGQAGAPRQKARSPCPRCPLLFPPVGAPLHTLKLWSGHHARPRWLRAGTAISCAPQLQNAILATMKGTHTCTIFFGPWRVCVPLRGRMLHLPNRLPHLWTIQNLLFLSVRPRLEPLKGKCDAKVILG